MQTLAELRLVPLIDDATRRWIPLFMYAEPEQQETDKRLFSRLRHDFSTRLDIPLYYRLGQQQENGYRGDALYHRMRYQIGNSRHFQAGLRVEKDAGERYYDSYGAYAMLHDVGILDKLGAGRKHLEQQEHAAAQDARRHQTYGRDGRDELSPRRCCHVGFA